MTDYPVEVFVDVQAQQTKAFAPVYRLIRRDEGAICRDWYCSHFVTIGSSVLRYDPNLDTGKAVTLCCQTDPVQIVTRSHLQRFTFCGAGSKTPLTMTYRVEVSGQQIKRGATNPIKLFKLDDPLGDLSYQWCHEVTFEGRAYGQREEDRVWIETAGTVRWK